MTRKSLITIRRPRSGQLSVDARKGAASPVRVADACAGNLPAVKHARPYNATPKATEALFIYFDNGRDFRPPQRGAMFVEDESHALSRPSGAGCSGNGGSQK